MHPLDSGSLTITNTRPASLPELERCLVNCLLTVDYFSEKGNIEIEGRIGRLVSKVVRGEVEERLELPFAGEVVLKPPEKLSRLFDYGFTAGVAKSQFDSVLQRLTDMKDMKLQSGTSQRNLHKVKNMTITNTVDEIYSLKDFPGLDVEAGLDSLGVSGLRITYPRLGYPECHQDFLDRGKPQFLEVLCKQKCKELNVFTGLLQESHDPLDYRLAVNIEYDLTSYFQGEKYALPKYCKTTRFKDRTSFKFKGFQVDLTKTECLRDLCNDVVYEVEAELDWNLFKPELEKYLKNGKHTLYERLTDFINAVRDITSLCCVTSSHDASGGASSGKVDLQPCRPSQASLATFGEVMAKIQASQSDKGYRPSTPFLPVIGDYCYHLCEQAELDIREEHKYFAVLDT